MRVEWIKRPNGCMYANGYPMQITRSPRDGSYVLQIDGYTDSLPVQSLHQVQRCGESIAMRFDHIALINAPALTGGLVLDRAP